MPSMVSDSAETTLSTAFKTPPRVGREGQGKAVKLQSHFATALWWLLKWLNVYQHPQRKDLE